MCMCFMGNGSFFLPIRVGLDRYRFLKGSKPCQIIPKILETCPVVYHETQR